MTAWNAIKQAPRKLGEAAAQARPTLVGITSPPRRMSSLMFGVVMVGILVAGLVGVLVLSTALQTREFELRAKQRTASELAYQVSDLESKVDRANAPRELGRRATALGMVVCSVIGAVLGYAIAALGWRWWIAAKWKRRGHGRSAI